MLRRSFITALTLVLVLPFAASATQKAGVDAGGYDALAGSTITWGDLFSRMSIGSTDQIANSTVSLKDTFNAAIAALNAKGDATSVTAATALGQIVTSVDPTLTFKFGDIFNVAVGEFGQVAALSVNVLQLVGATAMAANRQHLISSDIPVTVPGVSNVHMKMGVIESPAEAYGPVGTSAHTGQVRTEFDLTLTQPLTVGLSSAPMTLKIYLESASGTATLENIGCASAPAASPVTLHAVTNAATASVGQVTASALTNPSVPPTVSPDQVATIPGVVSVTATATATIPGAAKDSVMSGSFTRTDTVGATSVSLSALKNSLNVTANALGAGVNTALIASQVTAALGPVIDAVGPYVLDQLSAEPFGIEFAGADLTNASVDCNARRLFG